jgi:hypothetical protein
MPSLRPSTPAKGAAARESAAERAATARRARELAEALQCPVPQCGGTLEAPPDHAPTRRPWCRRCEQRITRWREALARIQQLEAAPARPAVAPVAAPPASVPAGRLEALARKLAAAEAELEVLRGVFAQRKRYLPTCMKCRKPHNSAKGAKLCTPCRTAPKPVAPRACHTPDCTGTVTAKREWFCPACQVQKKTRPCRTAGCAERLPRGSRLGRAAARTQFCPSCTARRQAAKAARRRPRTAQEVRAAIARAGKPMTLDELRAALPTVRATALPSVLYQQCQQGKLRRVRATGAGDHRTRFRYAIATPRRAA